MVEDAKMSDATEAEEKKDEETKEEEKAAPVVALPPLEAAAQRLERLLSDQVLDFYTNPVKVVRRWLGTSSGAAAGAQAADIASAAAKLLDPALVSAGRSLLVDGGGFHGDDNAMDISEQGTTTEETETKTTEEGPTYLTKASSREVEAWLISLAVRLLWKQGKHTEAFELSQKGIEIINNHLEQHSSSSLFPLLARMFRLRSLAAESLHSPAIDVGLRVGMAKAHNIATLRRDVETQATLLNCMLRDLLRHSQSTYSTPL